MAKVDAPAIAALKALFDHGDTMLEGSFQALFDAIADAAEDHAHTATGGPASGTGDASLIPNWLGYYLSQAKPFNSKGNSFTTVQATIDDLAANGWVFVPPGTWTEPLTIDENYVTLFGAGWSSIITTAASDVTIHIPGDFVHVYNLQLAQTATAHAITSTGDFVQLVHIYCSQAGHAGIKCDASLAVLVRDCLILNVGMYEGISIDSPRSRVINNIIGKPTAGIARHGIMIWNNGDDSIIQGNTLDTIGEDGIKIHADGENCVVDGNRITNIVGDPINDLSGTSTIGDNDLT